MRSKFFIAFYLGLVSHGLLAQFEEQKTDSLRPHQITAESSFITSTGNTVPYWLVANNSGRINPENARSLLFTLKARKEAGQKTLDYFYSFEAQSAFSVDSKTDIIQSYAGVRFKVFDFHVGLKEERFGLNDSTISIGNLTYGNNARPIPKVVLSTPGWVKSPVLGSIFTFKAYMAHGWFERNRYQSNAFLHQKLFYLRAKALNQRLALTVGLHHNAQWGGSNLDQETQQPTGFSNFTRIFLGSSGGADALSTDQRNALGNHLGSYDLSASYDFGSFTIRNYWQFIWEDKSGLTPFNWRDGLIGLSIKIKKPNSLIGGFTAELVRTSSQDAVKYNDGIRIFEPDNYFNNTVYRSGWTYHQRMIGSPVFMILNPEVTSNQKIKNAVNGINLGMEGHYGSIGYRINYLSFKNHGTLKERINPGLTLNLISFDGTLTKGPHVFGLTGSIEWGNYPGNNVGVMVSYARSIHF